MRSSFAFLCATRRCLDAIHKLLDRLPMIAGPKAGARSAPLASFEFHLAREIIQSELTRMAVLAGIFGVLMIVFPLVAAIFHDDYVFYVGAHGVRYAAGLSAALVCYELLIRYLFGRRLRLGSIPPGNMRFVNALIETSVPTILIVLVAQIADPVRVLQGPASFLYAIFIVLSTLSLNFALCAFTGIVAALQYVAVSFAFAYSGGSEPIRAAFAAPGFILLKGLALLLAGIAAGFVAGQLKRRVIAAFRAAQERQRIVNAFGQQVSPEIVEELLRQGPEIASRRAFVCVLFMDIRDFTHLVQDKSPEQIVAFQNAVFGAAVEIVNRRRGVINQFLGDGFMATFGAPLATGDECCDALAAARELVASVRALSDAGRIPAAIVGIGLHAGEVVTGNIGSAERRQYSITGNVVILASRIEQLNKVYGSQLLISGEVMRACGAQAGDAAPLGPVHVKGRDEPIDIYRIA